MTPTWRVTPMRPPRVGLLARLLAVFRRREPTTFQRCLGVHVYFADPRNGGALR